MKRVLVHSYHFPPIGGSGAQRPLKMVRGLARNGWEPVVVTVGGATADRWAPEDPTLLAEIPPDVQIRRVTGSVEPEPSAWRRFAERWLGVPERWGTWWSDASYRVALEAGSDVDLIYVWMQPYASASVGATLSRTLGRPWVADLGDPWALDEMMIYPTAVHRRSALRRMRALLATASAIVMSTSEAAARLLGAFPELARTPIAVIPNGFDSADFAGEVVESGDVKFRIAHTGYLHTDIGELHRRRRFLRRALGGSVQGVDILTRSHRRLVEAVNRLVAGDPSLASFVELHFAGVLSEADREVDARCPVTMHGYMSHAESIRLMRTANLLFLPMQNLPPGVRATIVPGKTYEYLASGTPILAAVPDGDARDILEEAGNAIVVRPDDVAGMARGIQAEIERFRAGLPAKTPDPAVVGRFEYGKLAAELAALFDTVLETPSAAAAPAAR